MRMILRAYPDNRVYVACQCTLYSNGKYSTVLYRFDGIVSKVEGVGLWDYNALVNHGNKWLLEKL